MKSLSSKIVSKICGRNMLFNPLCADDDEEHVERWPACSLGNHHYAGKWYDRFKKRTPPKEFLK